MSNADGTEHAPHVRSRRHRYDWRGAGFMGFIGALLTGWNPVNAAGHALVDLGVQKDAQDEAEDAAAALRTTAGPEA